MTFVRILERWCGGLRLVVGAAAKGSKTMILSRTAFLLAALIGAHACASTVINGGNIVNQTWTVAGSPYMVKGDITIPAGAFLTIQPGVSVQVAATDLQHSGADPSRVEINVFGTLNLNGSAAAPVTIQSSATPSSQNDWAGIDIDPAATVAISFATIKNATYGVLAGSAGTTITDSYFNVCYIGIYVYDGSPVINRNTMQTCGEGAVCSGQATLQNCYFNFCTVGIDSEPSPGQVLNVLNCTVMGNNSANFGIATAAGAVTHIDNTIVASCAGPGVKNLGTTTVTYSDIWNNSPNYSGAAAGTGCISANPMFNTLTFYPQLRAGSPCIDSGDPANFAGVDISNVARPIDGDNILGALPDMGACEYACSNHVYVTTPPADAQVSKGHPVSFSVGVSGSPSYQWKFNGNNITDGRGITGATTSQLSIDLPGPWDAGTYTVVITSDCGSVTSAAATLTVGPACGSADFNGDGDIGTDLDIEAFFRVLAGGGC